MLTQRDIRAIILQGTLQIPASKRYGANARVICDHCNKTDLTASIGLTRWDLCLLCVDNFLEGTKGTTIAYASMPAFAPGSSDDPACGGDAHWGIGSETYSSLYGRN